MRVIDLMDQDLILTIRSNSLKPNHSMRHKTQKSNKRHIHSSCELLEKRARRASGFTAEMRALIWELGRV